MDSESFSSASNILKISTKIMTQGDDLPDREPPKFRPHSVFLPAPLKVNIHPVQGGLFLFFCGTGWGFKYLEGITLGFKYLEGGSKSDGECPRSAASSQRALEHEVMIFFGIALFNISIILTVAWHHLFISILSSSSSSRLPLLTTT